MRDDLAKELEKIGLSENEAKVYLAGLELGPSTAQMIAAKATVSRPTTYIMIESLIKRGLMSSFQKGKKKSFSSAAPNQILYIILAQQHALQEQEKRLKQIIHDLNQVSGADGLNPDITVYEGIDGLKNFQEDILASKTKDIYELTSLDQVRKFLPPMFPGDRRESIGKKFEIKSLFTGSDDFPKELSNEANSKKLDSKKYDIAGEVVVFGDKVAFTSYGNKMVIVSIKNENIARTVRTMFMALWNAE